MTFFTLSEGGQKQIPVHGRPHARLGLALELCALRFMGFVPDDLTNAPLEAVTFVPRQNSLTRALQVYDRLVKTLFTLSYLESQDYRRCINAQLNKGGSCTRSRIFHSRWNGSLAGGAQLSWRAPNQV
jgi:hypothetical protein